MQLGSGTASPERQKRVSQGLAWYGIKAAKGGAAKMRVSGCVAPPNPVRLPILSAKNAERASYLALGPIFFILRVFIEAVMTSPALSYSVCASVSITLMVRGGSL